MRRRSIVIEEEFGVYHVTIDARTTSGLTLSDALVKAAITKPEKVLHDVLKVQHIMTAAGVIEALLPEAS